MILYNDLVVVFVMVMFSGVVVAGPYCSRPVSPQFGGWHATTHGFRVGTTVKFYCLPGYHLVGSQTGVCATDGVHAFWAGGVPRCLRHGKFINTVFSVLIIHPGCTPVNRCLDPGSPENGRHILGGTGIGDKVQFVCHDGFKLQGSTELVCQNGGKWSNPIPKCVTSK